MTDLPLNLTWIFFLLEKVFTYQVSQQVLDRNLAKNR